MSARLRYVQARIQIARLERELSGCDWCCGGGSAQRNRAIAQQTRAAEELRALGEPLPIPLCCNCSYHDAVVGNLCALCAQLNHKGQSND